MIVIILKITISSKKTKFNKGDIMQLTDVTTVKNRLGDIIEHEKDEMVTLGDLIIFCESAGAIKTASTLKNLLQHEKNETMILKDLMTHFEKEEARLMSISPESRYPFVSERYQGVSEGIEQAYKGYMVRNPGDRYRGYAVRERSRMPGASRGVSEGIEQEYKGYMVRNPRSRY